MSNYRIGILGIGGTGGFFGGKLALHYVDDENVDIVFIARNETKQAIQNNGLTVKSVEGYFIAYPSYVSDNIIEIGKLDILLVCVKSFALEEAIDQYKSCVKMGGVIITIQNLVNQVERLEKLMPEKVDLLEGCAYIISNISSPGNSVHKGGPATLFFGSNKNRKQFLWVEELFRKADIKVTLSNDIKRIIWQKFLFVSPVAVASNYFKSTLGELNQDPVKKDLVKLLMLELFQLIEHKGIQIERKQIEEHLELLAKMPVNGKSSFQLDVEKGNRTEVDSLLKYVVDEGKIVELTMPKYQSILEAFEQR